MRVHRVLRVKSLGGERHEFWRWLALSDANAIGMDFERLLGVLNLPLGVGFTISSVC